MKNLSLLDFPGEHWFAIAREKARQQGFRYVEDIGHWSERDREIYLLYYGPINIRKDYAQNIKNIKESIKKTVELFRTKKGCESKGICDSIVLNGEANIDRNITPEWIDSLKYNEIFVFGCRNSGRHFDGASNFALKHFGAVMGQREGRQGQSYAIPTIGGTIGLNEIRKSVDTFTEYAIEHPELHFLVTPVGCGGGCCKFWEIAPMFRKASKLQNVSLPEDFWIELDKGRIAEIKQKLAVKCDALLDMVSEFFGELRFMRLKMMSPSQLYRELISRDCHTISLSEQMEWAEFYDATITGSWNAEYLINHSAKCAYMILDNKKRVRWIKNRDIDWTGFLELPREVQKRVRRRECKYTFGIIGEYKNGVIKIVWQISPDGGYHYLDKYYGGKTTDEKDIWLQGVIDANCKIVEKLRICIKAD